MLRAACFAAAIALALLACGPPSKHEILSKAEHVEKKAELEATLGAPDERDALGPVETWTYAASDGSVSFLITGENVSLRSTGGALTAGAEEEQEK